jgi:hypothetical protein
MKIKKFEKTLALNKQTVSNLEESMMNDVKGGSDTLKIGCLNTLKIVCASVVKTDCAFRASDCCL